MLRKSLLLSSLLLASASLWAGTYTFNVKTRQPAVDYKPGEQIVFDVQLLEDGQPVTGKKIKWDRSGDDGVTDNGIADSDEVFSVTTSSEQPGFIRLRLAAVDAEGTALQNGKRKVTHTAGAAVNPELFTVAEEPADFDAFWQKQKDRLAEVEMVELERVPVDSKQTGIVTYDIKVSSAGGKPVSGYLSMPENAKDKSLPLHVVFFGYGVYPIGSQSGMARDRIVLAINAHGMPNGQPREYYTALSNGELKNYAFNQKENENPETTYFNGMMLRALRALEYGKSLPQWNGKKLTVSGHSQGGMQAAVVAGLDADVTDCAANQPWMCDVGGAAMGHLRGGWHIRPTEALLYYDPVYHVRRFDGNLKLDAGLGDYVCPPSGMAAMHNNTKGPSKITYTQSAGHTGSVRGEQFVHKKD